jgi:hypothetical protein
MAETHPRRSLLLFALGTAMGLGLAAYGLFSAAGTKIAGVPAEDVALINGRHILRSDFIMQTQVETALPFAKTTPAQRRKVLNEMVDEELLVQRGLEVDLAASDPDVRMAEVNGVLLQVDADVIASHPDDKTLLAYYNAHKDRYASEGIMDVRDLIIEVGDSTTMQEAMDKATKAAAAFRGGKQANDVAATFDLKDSGDIDLGDIFDFAAKIKFAPALYDAAVKLKTGQSSDPIVITKAVIAADNSLHYVKVVHVLCMEKRLAPEERSFTDARDAVLADYKKDEQTRIENANLAYLKSKADIQLAPEFRQ